MAYFERVSFHKLKVCKPLEKKLRIFRLSLFDLTAPFSLENPKITKITSPCIVETPTIYKKTIMQISQKHFCCEKNADIPYLLQTDVHTERYEIQRLFCFTTAKQQFYHWTLWLFLLQLNHSFIFEHCDSLYYG